MSASKSYERVIESWMRLTLKNGGIERLDDLHVDQMDARWKPRKFWMSAGFKALKSAVALKSRYHFPVDVTLAFSLRSAKVPRGIDFKNETELQKRLDWSPPSLYLLRPGTKPWHFSQGKTNPDPVEIIKRVDIRALGFSLPFKESYHVEFKPRGSSEYSRSLFFMGIRRGSKSL